MLSAQLPGIMSKLVFFLLRLKNVSVVYATGFDKEEKVTDHSRALDFDCVVVARAR